MPAAADRGPSLRDVAKRAGVSHQTVSRVINDSPKLRPQTRDRVLKAIAELGYRPSALARALAQGRSRRIGLLMESSSHFGPMSTLRGMELAARLAGYSTTMYLASPDSPGEFAEGAEFLQAQEVEGIAVIAPRVHSLESLVGLSLPKGAVILGALAHPEGEAALRPDLPRVGVDQERGIWLGLDHLLELGHTRIAHLAGPQDWLDARARNNAWRTGMEAAGLDTSAVIEGDWRAESGYAATADILAMDGLTAVLAANDQMALGLIHGLAEAGKRIPEDISVIGFDNVPESAHYRPPLTTVHQDFEAVGTAGIAAILEELGEPGEPVPAVVEPHLVVRLSTGAPRSDS